MSFGILIFKESNTDQLSLSKMETIISNPGLHHLAEKVFWNLDGEDLRNCAQINQSCQQILQHLIFYLRKFKGLSMKNRKIWIKVIQYVKTSDQGIAIIPYISTMESEETWNDFSEGSRELCSKSRIKREFFYRKSSK